MIIKFLINLLKKITKKIIDLDHALSVNENGILIKFLNIAVKQTLKSIRKIY